MLQAEKTSSKPVPRRKSTTKDKGNDVRDEQGMGAALRSVYQRTVSEDVPQEMLDLLGKLG